MKFTFKTDNPTGRFKSFEKAHHKIKLNKKECGLIIDKEPYRIGLMVYEKDIMEDGNKNCAWKWIWLQKKSKTLEEAKGFLNLFCDKIIKKYSIHQLD